MNDLNFSPEFEEKVRRAVDVPNASPEFVNRLRNELAGKPTKTEPRFVFRPAWAVAFVFALAVAIASAPGVTAAIGRLLGYVPEVGIVENTGSLRILAEPVSVTREGITLTIDYVYVYADHVELAYSVTGIPAQNDGWQAEDATTNPTAFCGGVNVGDMASKDGDARLRLPDGTLLERDYTGKYPQNAFAMKPVYEASIPADGTEMTLVLKCIPISRLGVVPENWEVPFSLVSVPPETVIGAPVIEVAPTNIVQSTVEPVASPVAESPAIPQPVVNMTLHKMVPMDATTIYYFSLDIEDSDPSLISIMPVDAYLIDSLGQKIDLIGNFPWQPFEHRVGSLFEYRSASKPADGPMTVVVENAVAYYAPLYVEPPQATPEEMSFTFDVSSDPQQGQTWELNNEFEIAGYDLKVTSARAVIWEEVQEPSFIDGSQGYEFGYQFAVEAEPGVKFTLWMDIMSESPMCWLTTGVPHIPSGSSLLYTQLCRERYPSGLVKVTIAELAVLLENTWQFTWTP
ncbi:MAG TPA: DUF4179 domain-containing protein [Anaerolineales bacterium]|nr:DUF4179 domain-containing protein [Anaerolineales bacterium]